jgi:tetratricopeptide (TPR) repeat protein
VRLETETSSAIERSQHLADTMLAVFERDSDDLGQGRVWSLRAQVAWIAGQMARADEAWCEAAACARRAGQERELFGVLRWRATAAVLGPTPVGEAIARCVQFREVVLASPVAVAWTDNALAVLLAGANATLGQLGSLSSSVSHHEALVGLLAGRPELAETPLREGVQRLAAMGDGGLLATTTAMLAQAVYAQGQFDEAGELCDATSATAARDDIITQVIWRGVKAKTLAREQRFDEGEALAREALALVAPTDLLSHHGDALLDLGEVLQLASRDAAARDAVRSGLALYDSKGNAAAATRARALLG